MNVPSTPILARRTFAPLSSFCGEVDVEFGLYQYPPTSTCIRLVIATQLRPSAVQIEGRFPIDIFATAPGATGALVSGVAVA